MIAIWRCSIKSLTTISNIKRKMFKHKDSFFLEKISNSSVHLHIKFKLIWIQLELLLFNAFIWFSWKTKGLDRGVGGQGNAHIEAADEGFFFTNCIKRGTKAEFLDKVHPENGFHCPITIQPFVTFQTHPKQRLWGTQTVSKHYVLYDWHKYANMLSTIHQSLQKISH